MRVFSLHGGATCLKHGFGNAQNTSQTKKAAKKATTKKKAAKKAASKTKSAKSDLDAVKRLGSANDDLKAELISVREKLAITLVEKEQEELREQQNRSYASFENRNGRNNNFVENVSAGRANK